VAVADAWQGRSLGQAALLLLEAVAQAHSRAAIELTTMQSNDKAYRCYERVGYEYLGIIRNPVGVRIILGIFLGRVCVDWSI
jgi:ribosomal protein S18 acetylase RimI-like enzyme